MKRSKKPSSPAFRMLRAPYHERETDTLKQYIQRYLFDPARELPIGDYHVFKIIAAHWKIESMHWLLDVTFSEDSCRFMSENAHKTLNSLRKLALALHKRVIAASGKKISLKSSMLKCLIDHNSLIRLISCL